MPLIFSKQHRHTPASSSAHATDRPPTAFRQAPSSTSFGSSHSQPRSPPSRNFLNAAVTGGSVIRRLSFVPHGLRRRASQRARRSITRLRDKGASVRKYFQNPKLFGTLAKNVYQRWHLKHLIPLFFVLLYMLLGAVLFVWLEAAAERERIAERSYEYERERRLFIKRMEEILVDTSARENPQKRRAYVEEAVDHLRKTLSQEPIPAPVQWTFPTAMYFSGTIFTTIGYGDVACATFMGRIATVIYAIFGIPLMLITLNELGKFLYKSINEFMAALNRQLKAIGRCCGCLAPAANSEEKKDAPKDTADAMEKGLVNSSSNQNNIGQNEKLLASQNSFDEAKAVAVSFNLHEAGGEELSLKLEAATDEDVEAGVARKGSSILKENNSSPNTAPVGKEFDKKESLAEQQSNGQGEEGEMGEEEEPLPPEDMQEAPRMHVMVAIVCTFAWIFFCAGLFRLWEDWSYWDSLYFMFISLLTVGLGDVNVERRDLMVLCFIFVIIGLSLVSMCINVIQSSLEDLYGKLLMKILMEYQKSLNKDGSHKNASLGVMQALGNSKTAKFLLPMLSENTKRSVMQKVQEEARETGIEIPPIFEHFETINDIMNKKDQIKDEEAYLDDILKPVIQSQQLEPSAVLGRSASFQLRENQTQTEIIRREDKTDQTTRAEVDELAIQTELTLHSENRGVDVEQQTDGLSSSDEGVQTASVEQKEAQSMTSISQSISIDIQTDSALCLDEEVQTFLLIDMFDREMQTDETPTKNQRIQTPLPVLVDAEAQSEEVNKDLEKIHGSRLREARRRLRQAFNRSKSRGIEDPTMIGWQEFADNNSSDEGSLDWDPIDGMHAERQKPVSQLKKIFDEGEVGTSRSRQGSKRSIHKK